MVQTLEPPRVAPPARRTPLVERVALWSATHRWTAIGLWALVVALTFGVGTAVGPRDATALDLGVGESGRASQVAADAGYVDPVVENVLITSPDGGPLTASSDAGQAADAAADDLLTGLGALDEVAAVTGPVPSDDGTAVLVSARLVGTADDAQAKVPALQDVVTDVQADHPDLLVEEVGTASIGVEFDEWLGADLEKATGLSIPLTLLILLVVFGAIVMAGVPLVLGVGSVASGLGLWMLASHLVPDPGMVLHLIVLVGLAVGVDYSLFYLRRFREEKHAGAGDVDAVAIAARTAGHSVVVSGIAVTLSMAGLYVAGDTTFSALATGAILVVLVALVSAVTVLPAMLVLLGRWVDAPRVPLLGRLSGREPRFVPALQRRVLARPVRWAVGSVLLLVALAAPLLGISLHNTTVADFPRTLSTMQSYDRLVAAYPEQASAVQLVVQVPAGQEDALLAGIADLPAAADPWVSDDGRTAVVPLDEPLDQVRADDVPAVRDATGASFVGVTGEAAQDADFTANLQRAMPVVVAAVLALTFGVMLLAFRSLAVAGLTVVLNLLSLGATFGILTAVAQGSWAEALGFPSSGHVVSWIPLLVFVVLSGLSLDYHVFVVSRIREHAQRGVGAAEAIRAGVVGTAGAVTSAAVVMVAVFSIFGLLSFIELKQLGIGLAVGVLLDATLVRLVTLPALMLLARRWLWWPGVRARRAEVSPAGR
ncbi:RND superfamily putative drug exporter [Sediminihabitans luteus]|uniref:RND superfamily putative drug exporter n=1 Tax=Sediminihabitans luteus TaxID=1138585 RepID=A0A2M9D0P4_9CELL|nr:MMPL family transporter [Sediminihabitans luteus]PJJ77762.1 RND superfamily putative drug exporter [Sediminihabitans luteus]GIJ00011.1 membrane protein [Sediminihabitans luteus]